MRLTAKLLGVALAFSVSCGGGGAGLYLVSGTVTTTNAQGVKVPLAGVTVGLKLRLDRAGPVEPLALINSSVTDQQGHYGVRGSPGTYSLDAALQGYTFTPSTTFVTLVGQDIDNQDFQASPQATSTP
ncbi:MAG TPA: hypothetical protein VGH20_07505 [Myxococcales bacterium]|jgi:hypothetical protein